MSALLVGGYGSDMGGTAHGIRIARNDGGALAMTAEVLAADSPSWVAVRGDRIVATLEGSAKLAWFTREGDRWRSEGLVSTGLFPCHAAFLDDETVAVACYGDGAVVVARYGESEPLQRLEGSGSGPLPAQEGPHAHHVHVLPDARVLTLDLGADLLHVHERRETGLLERVASVALPPGTGPRDIQPLPSGQLVVLGEWSCRLLVLEAVGSGFEIVQTLDTPGAEAGRDQAAALALTPDGSRLYAGIRGANRVGVVAVTPEDLQPITSVASGGDWPRHLVLDGDLLRIAHQRSEEITTHRLDEQGVPVLLGAVSTPAPTCLVRIGSEALLS